MTCMDDKSTDDRSPLKASHHQRGFSEVTSHFPGIRLGGDSRPDIVHLNYQEGIDTNNDVDYDYNAFFSQYINVDNNDEEEKCVININQGKENIVNNNEGDTFNLVNTGDDEDKVLQLDRTQCNGHPLSIQTVEANKAMSAAKLAELWIADPKRAKRILANRQSAARSKERKARYISQLERKVKSLETEATALATQFNVYKEDLVHLAAENRELKLRLQTMEHQAQLQDDITEAMMGEVERLRFATGEIVSSSSLKLGMQSQVHHHLLPVQCSTPAAADRQYSFKGLPPRLSCQPIISHYWPSLHQQ